MMRLLISHQATTKNNTHRENFRLLLSLSLLSLSPFGLPSAHPSHLVLVLYHTFPRRLSEKKKKTMAHIIRSASALHDEDEES
jgi:hypothetical protein